MEPGRTERVKTPAKTGAQQVVAKPEKSPRTKIEGIFWFSNFGLTCQGSMKRKPRRIEKAKISKRMAPPI